MSSTLAMVKVGLAGTKRSESLETSGGPTSRRRVGRAWGEGVVLHATIIGHSPFVCVGAKKWRLPMKNKE